jgi:perosamine synthetase
VRNRLGKDSPKPYVRVRPTLPLSVLVGSSRGGRLPPPLDAGAVTFHFKARNGIWRVMQALGLQESEIVLVPAYNCGAELDAVLRAPARVRFYRVDRRARIDLDDLRQAIEPATRCVIVTHYFGFSQPDLLELVELCRDRGLVLVEDCAHSLYSMHMDRPLGTFGDAGVFSLPKKLPMAYGGAVLANNTLHVESGNVDPPLGSSFSVLRSSLEGHAFLRYGRAGWAAASLSRRLAQLGSRAGTYMSRHSRTPRRGFDPSLNPHVTFDRSTASWSMSSTSRRIAYRSPHLEIARRRRQNYSLLAEQLAGVSGANPLYPTLSNGACPLAFPLVVDEPEELIRELQRGGIGADHYWNEFHPAFPAKEFPESTYLKTHVVALPIHQDLDPPVVVRMAEVVRRWSRSR